MAESLMKIIIKVINEASKELAAIKKDVGDVEKPANAAGEALKDMGLTLGKLTLIAGGAGIALKKAFEFAESGAAVAQTRESFDRLGISIEDLRKASRGTVDDMTIMSSTLMLTGGASEALTRSWPASTARHNAIAVRSLLATHKSASASSTSQRRRSATPARASSSVRPTGSTI